MQTNFVSNLRQIDALKKFKKGFIKEMKTNFISNLTNGCVEQVSALAVVFEAVHIETCGTDLELTSVK